MEKRTEKERDKDAFNPKRNYAVEKNQRQREKGKKEKIGKKEFELLSSSVHLVLRVEG